MADSRHELLGISAPDSPAALVPMQLQLADEAKASLLLQDAQSLALARSLPAALELVCRSASRHTDAKWAAAWTLSEGQVTESACTGEFESLHESLITRVGMVASACVWDEGPLADEPLIGSPIVLGENVIGGIAIKLGHAGGEQDAQAVIEFLSALCAIGIGHRSQVGEQEHKAEVADHARRQQADFLSMVSHDVRSPLGAIHGYARMMLHSPGDFSDETRTKALEAIISQSQRIETLVNGLLDMARSESGTLQLNLARVDVREVVQAAMLLADPEGKYTVELPAEPVMAAVDSVRIEQIIVNLVSNALKYGSEPYTISLTMAQREWTLRVSDSGAGLDQEVETHLFQRFVPGARSVGLGLSIVQALTDAHRGRVRYSRDNDITTFTLTVPVDPLL